MQTKYSAQNERIKRDYFHFLREAKGQSESTVDAVAKAIHRFEDYNKFRDFKTFHYEQASGFKRHLSEQKRLKTGERLSKATLYATLQALKRFFQWLATQPGYKSKIQYSDAEYFNLSEKDTRVATAHREKPVPTIEQIQHVLETMPVRNEIDMRNRALVAFTLLTGARDSAIASLKMKHLDMRAGVVYQDAREVNTKFSKTFMTYFFPVGDNVQQIVNEWVEYLKVEKLWGNDDPLFPATRVSQNANRQFAVSGLARAHWSGASPIREIFRKAFTNAGLPYFNPHTFRNTLVRLGEDRCKSPEEFKAWSQNLGHEKVLTTFLNYGAVARDRQKEIFHSFTAPQLSTATGVDAIAEAVFKKMQDTGFRTSASPEQL